MTQKLGYIETRFTYHPPNDEKTDLFVQVREAAKTFAYVIDTACPDGREAALAMTKLEESVMWANAAIARSGQ